MRLDYLDPNKNLSLSGSTFSLDYDSPSTGYYVSTGYPSLKANGVSVGETIYLYTNAICTSGLILSSTITSNPYIVYLSSGLSTGQNYIYAKTDSQSCTLTPLTYFYDNVGPNGVSSIDDGSTLSGTNDDADITWAAASDNSGGSGISHYMLGIGSSVCGSDIMAPTNVGNVTAYTVSGLTWNQGTTYYATLYPVDFALNWGSPACGDGFSYPIPGWNHNAFIKSDTPTSNANFGYSTSASGDTVVVGSPFETVSGLNYAGAVYVYRKVGNTLSFEAKLTATNVEASDYFGISVSISGDTIAVGATGEDSSQNYITNGTTSSSNNSLSDSGAVYVFQRSGSTWTQEAYIKAANADSNDNYGDKVIIDGNTLAVSAKDEDSSQSSITNGTTASSDNSFVNSGAVYIYKRTGVSWDQEAYIKAYNADANDKFGMSISLHGSTLAVGSSYEDSNQTSITNGTTASNNNSLSDSGAVYVYQRSGSTWFQEAYIKATNANSIDGFGFSISIYSDTLAVSARGESSSQSTITNGSTASSDNTTTYSGAVYIYQRSSSVWSQQAYIKVSNLDVSDNFGESISLFGDTLIASSIYEDSLTSSIVNGSSASSSNSGIDAGAVYVFKRVGTNWSQTAYIKPQNPQNYDYFGGNVCALDEDSIIVGSIQEDSSYTGVQNGSSFNSNESTINSGAAYFYILN